MDRAIDQRPVAVALGCRYGVGPELVARHLAGRPDGPGLLVVGDSAVLERGARDTGVKLAIPRISEPEELCGPWAMVHRDGGLPVGPLGRVDAGSGAEMLAVWDRLIEWAADGRIGGIVYAPLNKQAMQQAGHEAGDELDYLLNRLPPNGPAGEINVLGDLWTSRVTSHVPIAEVARRITMDAIMEAVRTIGLARRQAGFERTRIAVAALNPHAGEGGLYGREEIDVIAPAVEALRADGVNAEGPFPADTVFPRALRGDYDAVVTMYHDQGQIALKLVGLGQSVTLLAGFPVPIATPGHGTAYDIAGKGTARSEGFEAALALVSRVAGKA